MFHFYFINIFIIFDEIKDNLIIICEYFLLNQYLKFKNNIYLKTKIYF
jgi:hypothetical protein